MKKTLALFMIIIIMLTVSGCGCEHGVVSDATCNAPQTCLECGETFGSALSHNWMDATCETPKKCTLCGATEGIEVGHQWEDATCTTPQICKICKIAQGSVAGHNYNGTECTICKMEDPSYSRLKEVGFITKYGLDRWMEIDCYGASWVGWRELETDTNPRFYFKLIGGNYFRQGYIPIKDIKNIEDALSNYYSSFKTLVYSVVSNDIIQYESVKGGYAPYSIVDRVINADKTGVIIKISNQTRWHTKEEWYVPVDLLDFSTITKGEVDEDGYVKYIVNFKK